MNTQDTLFPDVPSDGSGITVGVRGSVRTLSRAQKQFNKLVGEIALLRQRLEAWREFPARYLRRVDEEMRPLEAALRQERIALLGILDCALLGKGLTRREKSIARELLASLLMALIETQAPDAELVALAARHGLELPSDEDSDALEAMRSLGAELFGFDVDADHGATTPEDLARLFAEKLEAEEAERAGRRKARTVSAKVRQREALAERLAEDASRTLREIYRKLARELHPDRIADDEERSRKTALMQDANRAYEARDLLTLLELQWRIEQIDPAGLASLAEEKIAHFNHVLKEQVRCLGDEIEEHAAPFFLHFERAPPRDLQPVHVEREMDRQSAEMREVLAGLQRDLGRYDDIAELKRDLREYERAPSDKDFEDFLDVLAREMPKARRPRTARRQAKKQRR